MNIRRWFIEWTEFHGCWLDGGCIIEDAPEFAVFDVFVGGITLTLVILALLWGRRRNRFRRRGKWIS